MNLPFCGNSVHSPSIYAADQMAPLTMNVTAIIPLGKGGGGGGPTPPGTGVCATSCVACFNSGYHGTCGYNQWCANKYPGSPGVPGQPYGCER